MFLRPKSAVVKVIAMGMLKMYSRDMSKHDKDAQRIFRLTQAINEALYKNKVHCVDCAVGVLIGTVLSMLTECGRTHEEAYALIRELLDTHQKGIEAILSEQAVVE